MKRALIIIYAIFFSLSALYAAIADGTQIASAAGGQTWYMVDDASGVTGANYEMGRDAGTSGKNGSTDTLNIAKSTSAVWVAALNTTEESSNVECRVSGSWTVSLYADGEGNSASSLTVDIGILTAGGTFTSYGTSAEQTVEKAGSTLNFSVTATSMTISPTEYLAVRINCTSLAKGFDLDVLGASTSPCYVTSPSGVSNDDYPGTQNISLTITDNGGATGIDFGTLNAGPPYDNAEVVQSLPTTGAVAITIETGTNVDVNIQIKGTDFTGPGGTIPLGTGSTTADILVDDDASPRQGGGDTGKAEKGLTTSWVTWYPVTAHNSATVQVGYWMSIPSGQSGGAYTSTFSYQAILQ